MHCQTVTCLRGAILIRITGFSILARSTRRCGCAPIANQPINCFVSPMQTSLSFSRSATDPQLKFRVRASRLIINGWPCVMRMVPANPLSQHYRRSIPGHRLFWPINESPVTRNEQGYLCFALIATSGRPIQVHVLELNNEAGSPTTSIYGTFSVPTGDLALTVMS